MPTRGVVGRSEHGQGYQSFSYPDFQDYSVRAKTFATLVAYKLEALNVTTSGEPQRATGMVVSGNYFNVLQVLAYRGRLLSAEDDRVGAAPVAVATYAAWRKYFNGDAAAVGKTVSVNGQIFTLVGVAATDFRGTIALLAPEFYVPINQLPMLKPGGPRLLDSRGSTWLTLGARLAPGVTEAFAQTEFTTIAKQLAETLPLPRQDVSVDVVPLRCVPGEMRGGLTAFIGLLFVLITLVLLVACVNVASMLLARGESRLHEIAMRFVLGASRRRVIVQLLIESALLAIAAGALGVLLSIWCCKLLALIDPPTPYPISLQVPIDTTALLFALACTALTALVFGLVPALRLSSRAPAASQLLGGRQIAGRRSRLGAALVVTQIALTMILLVSGGLFMHALQRASAINTGIDPSQTLTADFNLDPSGYPSTKQSQLQQVLLQRVRAMPGIDSAALSALVPLDVLSRMENGSFQIPGVPEDSLTPSTNQVSTGFFNTLGITVQGRDFDEHDTKGSAAVCVVNSALAHLLSPDGDVVGHSFAFKSDKDPLTLTVVGIVANGKYTSLSEDNEPFLFLPLTQWPRAETSLVAKTRLLPNAFAMQLRAELHALDASLPVGQVHPLTDVIAVSLLPQRIAGMASLALGTIGLLLAAIGLYGLIAMHVANRKREFGVRLALGASPKRIVADVLRRGAWLSGTGLAIGTALSLGGAVLVSGLLYGVNSSDALEFLGAAVLLGAIALLASFLPARRAARIDPMVALRHE
ncbi:MAG: ABC transporter permease [Dokdonella sp.]